MKTDRFTDSIRRKLESIRPEFTEKDWANMQKSLHQANLSQPGSPPAGNPFSGGLWTAKSWLLAAASVSTVVLIAFSVWQRREITQLRQTLGQQNPQSTRSAMPGKTNMPAPGPEVDSPSLTHAHTEQPQPVGELPAVSDNKTFSQPRPDTVYIDRYVAVPSPVRTVPPEAERPAQRSDNPAEKVYAGTTRAPASANQPNKSDNLTHNQQTDTYGASSTLPTVDNNNPNSSITNTESANTLPAKERKLLNSYAEKRQKNGRKSSANSANDATKAVTRIIPVKAEQPAQVSEPSATYALAKSLPLTTLTINWTAKLAQQAKRMRPTLPAPPTEQPVEKAVEKAPDSQPINRMATRFRMGIGGEVASTLWRVGVFTEVLVGKHWAVGVGLNQATYNGRFINDFDFDARTRRDFRKEFARGIDPKRDILNIDASTTRLQIPLSLGYRIPLTKTLSLLPTVGTYLDLNSNEDVTFYCPIFLPQRGFDEIKYSATRSVALINTFTLGAGLEWQRGHWVLQGSPVLTIPLQADPTPMQPDLNWQKNTAVSLRARLLYQF